MCFATHLSQASSYCTQSFSILPLRIASEFCILYLDDSLALLMVVLTQGMGEPLNNYAALVEAIQIMTGFPFQLSPKKITVSTVGTNC